MGRGSSRCSGRATTHCPRRAVPDLQRRLLSDFGKAPEQRSVTGPTGAIRVGAAVYNPAPHTVTLYPVSRLDLHKRYTLTVIGTGAGGVKGVAGNLLDGAGNGRAGSNYVVTVDASDLVVTNPYATGAAAALRLA